MRSQLGCNWYFPPLYCQIHIYLIDQLESQCHYLRCFTWHMIASHQGIVCSMHVDGREGRTRRTTNYDYNESKASKVPPQLVTTDTEHPNVLTMTGQSALFLFLCWHRGTMGVSPRHIQVFQVSSCKLNVQLPCQCVVIPGL